MPWHRIAAPCEMMVNSSGLDGRSNRKDRFSFCVPRDEIWKGGTRVDEGPVPGMKRAGVVLLLETAAVVHLEYQDERCWLAQFGISRRERKFVRGFCPILARLLSASVPNSILPLNCARLSAHSS